MEVSALTTQKKKRLEAPHNAHITRISHSHDHTRCAALFSNQFGGSTLSVSVPLGVARDG